jgi:hypothetical protein
MTQCLTRAPGGLIATRVSNTGDIFRAGECVQLHPLDMPQLPACPASAGRTLQHAVAPECCKKGIQHRCKLVGEYEVPCSGQVALLVFYQPAWMLNISLGGNFGDRGNGSSLLLDAPWYMYWPETLLWVLLEASIATMFAVGCDVSCCL